MKCYELINKVNEESGAHYLLLCAMAMTNNNKFSDAIDLYERCVSFYKGKYGDKSDKTMAIYLKLIPLHIECSNTGKAFEIIDEFILKVVYKLIID